MQQKFSMPANAFAGHGFADVRKRQMVSEYRKVVARDRKNMGAWNEKLKKIYAETEHAVDNDPPERFGGKRKKKKKGVKIEATVGSEQETRRMEKATTVSPTEKSTTAVKTTKPDNLRYI